MSVTCKLSCLIILIITTCSSVSAEDVYKWTDSSGRVFFGPTPPSGAKNTTKLPKTTISRYSSKQLIEAWKPQGSALLEEDLTTPDKGLKDAKESAVDEARHDGVKLVNSKPELTVDSEGVIVSATVMITNEGTFPAENVRVTLKFQDGTLVPAVGPKTVGSKQEALFAVSTDHLPIVLAGVNSTNKEQDLLPNVELSFKDTFAQGLE